MNSISQLNSCRDVNQPNQAPGLFPTWVNGTLQLETLETPQDG
jgi:hypothetical protein